MTRVKVENRVESKVRVAIVEAAKQLKATFIDRDDAIDAIWVAMLAGANFILVGDPGTAKTALAMALFSHVTDARRFDVLCGSFVTPDQVFGPVDVMALKGRVLDDGTEVPGTYRRITDGRLADCELGFLDEVLKSNAGCVNSMLTALNERTFDGQKIPLRCCGSATNWPEVQSRNEIVNAFWDRILVRVPVRRVADEALRLRMLEAADRVRAYVPSVTITLEELDQARAEVERITVRDSMRRALVKTGEALGKHSPISDRRLAQAQRVLRARAWLDGRSDVALDDFDALRYCAWDQSEAHYNAAKAVTDALDQDVVRTIVAWLQQGIRECEQVKQPEHAPARAQSAANLVQKIYDYVEQNAVKTANWGKHIAPLVKQLHAEQQRIIQLVSSGLPKGKPTQPAPTRGTI